MISPLNVEELVVSLKQTKRLILIEEGVAESGLMGSIFNGFSRAGYSEKFSTLNINGFGDIGASQASENHALIGKQEVINKIIAFVKGI